MDRGSSAQTFLLLEIVDPEVNAFLWRIRWIISGQRPRGLVHVTLRGPYAGNDVPTDGIVGWRKMLRHDVLRIGGVGRFSNDSEEVVFFRVDSPNLRSVWWKPSFPIERFGFEPHITIYKGADRHLADAVSGFLATEAGHLLCAEYRLVWHRIRQPDLFTPVAPTVAAMDRLFESGRIDATVLDRLEAFVDEHRAARQRRASMSVEQR